MSEDLDLSRMIAYCAHLGMLYSDRRLRGAGYPGLLSSVLAARGVGAPEEAALFLERERCLTHSPLLMKDMDRAVDRVRLALRRQRTTDVQRAAWFYQIIRYSYASALTSYGSQPHDMRANFPLIEQAHRRLKDVVVENKDFEKLIRQYDRPVSLFYCDPPYHATEGYYQNIGEDGFTEKDHIRLRDALLSIEGKFLLSYNDDAFVRELYDAPGIQIEAVTRLNNIKQRYDPNCQFAEVFIANYDMTERQRAATQLNLFDFGQEI